jgi:hypothetical protein
MLLDAVHRHPLELLARLVEVVGLERVLRDEERGLRRVEGARMLGPEILR